MEQEREWGARIERGEVISAREDKYYRVASLERKGLVTREITSFNSYTRYLPGAEVYFFAFADGTGQILCPFRNPEEDIPTAE